MRAGAIGLENLIDGLSKQFVGLQGYPPTGGSRWPSTGPAFGPIHDGAAALVKALDAGDANGIVAATQQITTGMAAYGRAPPGAVRLGRPSCRTQQNFPVRLGPASLGRVSHGRSPTCGVQRPAPAAPRKWQATKWLAARVDERRLVGRADRRAAELGAELAARVEVAAARRVDRARARRRGG